MASQRRVETISKAKISKEITLKSSQEKSEIQNQDDILEGEYWLDIINRKDLLSHTSTNSEMAAGLAIGLER